MPSRRTTAVPAQADANLTPWQQLVLTGFQVKIALAKGFKQWEEDVRDALKNHLLSLPANEREIDALGLVKVAVISKGGKEFVDATAVENLFKFSLRNGTIRSDELLALFESGVLGIGNYPAVANLLGQRGVAGPHSGTYVSPGDPSTVTYDLRWQVLQPTATEGGMLSDIADRVHLAAGATLSPDDLAALLPQAAATVPAAPQASDTVAVRARNPRRSRPRQP